MHHTTFMKSAAAAALLSAFASATSAGGFQLTEQSALSLGRAYAGVGVDGTDVSGVYYNPATMTLHKGTQFQGGIVGVGLNLDYASDKGDAYDNNGRAKDEVVPHLYLSKQINDSTWFGLAFTVPFGLSTEYGSSWEQAAEGTDASIKVFDLNPNMGWKVNDWLSLGAGVSIQYVTADLGFNKPGLGNLNVKVDGIAWGWNVGMMVTPVENVRIGLSYRSAVGHDTEGDLSSRFGSYDANISMDAPAWAMLSAAWDVNSWLSLYSTFRWADWSSFQDLTIESPVLAGFPNNNHSTSLSIPKNWDDTYLLTVGYDARISDFWTLRGGIGYETSTVSDPTLRTGTIPDADRWWFAIGSSFHWSKNFQTDVAFAHLHGVHERKLYSNGSKIGDFRQLDAYLLGIQAQYRF